MSMIGGRSVRAVIVVIVVLLGAACGKESGEGAADGLGSSGGSLGAAGAHEHGVARVNVAVEGDGAVIEFFAPGQSIYGFEGESRGAEQEAARAAGVERLKQELPRMFAFDPSLDCRFGAPRIELEDGDHAEGHAEEDEHGAASDAAERGDHEDAHQDEAQEDEAREAEVHDSDHPGDGDQHDEVHAEVEVQCARSPEGTDLRLAVTESFPEITQVDLQVLSAARQSGARVAASGHTVRF